jgi:hypothetical protein
MNKMVKRSVREIIYFILIFLIFFLAVKLAQFWLEKSNMNFDMAYLIVGLLYTLVMVALFFLAKLQTKEGFWDVSDAAKCKGGPYFWQGDSQTSQMCREMAKTPEGKVAISGYNCPSGYVGQPGLPFYYSPLSDDNWKNERCEDMPDCPDVDVGLCSLQKQIP